MTKSDLGGWHALLAEVPRDAFVPGTIWITRPGRQDLVRLSRTEDPDGWQAAIAEDRFLVTQVNAGADPGTEAVSATSSCSMPSVVDAMLTALDVRPGHAVLEIGTGTGWNAAHLSRRAGTQGRVVTIEVDPAVADQARSALATTGYSPHVVTGDGLQGYPADGPYDRVIATAAVNDAVPGPWLDQLRPGGRLVTPWATDWFNGAMLALDLDDHGHGTGRFIDDLSFMRIRSQHPALFEWEPDAADIQRAEFTDTGCYGNDFHRIVSPGQARFAIGARVPQVYLHIDWDARGDRHHRLELDDAATKSWAQIDVDLTQSRVPYRARQLGPRKLWNEIEGAYDWWHDAGEPSQERFGFATADHRQWIWLDAPDHVVRTVLPKTALSAS
ncbi:methyltransferase domain-containing protein [Amycolatopsis nigrescens]|uniref:methyltransferase domain-containing protein n=1 Tax=Amycolatopsis nigrescens TaxID=381445 RepID=UPI0007C5D053|nr:methyltransferase domain-containing protein [Amycolatopsis nigrescens]